MLSNKKIEAYMKRAIVVAMLVVPMVIGMASDGYGQIYSTFPAGTCDTGTRLAGYSNVSGVKRNKVYSLASLAAYIGATGGSDSLSSVLARGYWGGTGGIILGKRWSPVFATVCLNAWPASNISKAGSITLFDSSFVKHIHISTDSTFFDVPISVAHVQGRGSTPTIAAGAGAGSSPTVSVSATGTDLAGYIDVTTGSTPGTSATVVTVTFASAWASAPVVLLVPANNATKALSVAQQVFIDANTGVSTTAFVITSGGTALTGATAYRWSYVVMGTR